jgi:hypothetical protein
MPQESRYNFHILSLRRKTYEGDYEKPKQWQYSQLLMRSFMLCCTPCRRTRLPEFKLLEKCC